MFRAMKVALTIAGSDSGGGAGIQADLRTFAAHRVHGTSALSAVTAQNSVAVTAWIALEPRMVVAQIEAVASDMPIAATKTGMLANAEIIAAVAEAASRLALGPLVVDPVMVATSGARLLPRSAEHALAATLVPLATVVTPNVAEARVLAGDETLEGADLARAVLALGPEAVVVTGGDADGIDWLCDGDGVEAIGGPRYASGANHGSGCTHSASLAVLLAQGLPARDAARRAREIAAGAVERGLAGLGSGPGPVDVIGVGR